MFGTVGSPYLLIQAINIILTHILPNVVSYFCLQNYDFLP